MDNETVSQSASFATRHLPANRDVVAPDGSDVRVLLELSGGALAHFTLPAGDTSVAVRHRTVEEIWFIISGRADMWRRLGDDEETVELRPSDCLTIPVGTRFQFRSVGRQPFVAVGVTMPPWPGDGEAIESEGPWEPTVPPGPGLSAGPRR
jgi:mannose-6-phosphate isomerase-like protein (cupin superfamily)